jgi:hypothetical protein
LKIKKLHKREIIGGQPEGTLTKKELFLAVIFSLQCLDL